MVDHLAQAIAGLSPGQLELFLQRFGQLSRGTPEQVTRRQQPARPVPLSSAQMQQWFVHQLAPASTAYNLLLATHLRGHLDLAALRASLGELVRRHEALRTTFGSLHGEPVQTVQTTPGTLLWHVDLRHLPAAARERERTRLAEQLVRIPFDLACGPVLRCSLLRLADDESLLLLSLHHIVADGWSSRVLLNELATLYGAFRAGLPSPLPEPALQYPDYALWEHRRLESGALAEQVAYWRQKLSGAPRLLELPTDRPRPSARSWQGGHCLLRLGPELTRSLEPIARRSRATPFMVLLAAWKSLLARYTGSVDLLVGTPVANRTSPDLEGIVGPFANLLVLRTRLDPALSFRAVVERVREGTIEAFAHQDLPFDLLIRELEVERDLSRPPLVQTTFALQTVPAPDLAAAGLEMKPVAVETGVAKFDLSLDLTPAASETGGFLEYSRELFDASTVQRAAGHFLSLLAAAAAAPECPVAELGLLGPAERQQLLVEWTERDGGWDEGTALDELFARQAAASPGAVAVVCGSERASYGELLERADRLASRLIALGVAAETRVGLHLERSVAMVVAILGVLRAGGAYVPVEPLAPWQRRQLVLADAGIAALVVGPDGQAGDPAAGSSLPEALAEGLPVVRLDAAGALLDAPAEGRLPAPGGRATADNLAYVMFTSGSTGRPKGVGVTHRNVARLFASTRARFHFGPDDVWSLFHSYAFDFSVWELWGALLHGGRLVIVSFFVSRTPELFAELLESAGVTVLNQTPSAFRQLGWDGERAGSSRLRWIIFGGEALEPARLARWLAPPSAPAAERRVRLVNMYGITETTVHVTFRELGPDDARRPGASPVGRPLPDLAVVLLDAGLAPAPPGIPGEICVAGPGLARGYLGRPELTAERFVPDAWTGTPGARLYRSGDLARWSVTGELEYLGRRDQQVKVRGVRIEPAEIEHALLRHPQVQDAVAVVREDAVAGRQLVAYVVPRPGCAPAGEELREFLADLLPESMLPAFFVPLERLPLTTNGKVDRRSLPAPGGAQLESRRAYVAPRTPEEAILVEVWREVLRVERVSAESNFFVLGGDSLLTLSARARAAERGLLFSVQQLFENPVLRDLARVIAAESAAAPDATGGDRRGIPCELLADEDRRALPPGIVDAYPPSALQLGMLFHSDLHADHALYHDVQSHHLGLRWDEARMRQALAWLAARHPALRTAFDLAAFREPLALVHAAVETPLSVEDLRQVPAAEQESRLELWLARKRREPYDWGRPPLWRVWVHLRTPRSFQFTLAFHHAILDGWSLAVLATELFETYLTLLGDGEPPAGDGPACPSFAEFIRLERQAISSPEQRQHWVDQVGRGDATALPRWPTVRQPTGLARFVRQREAVPPPLHAALERLARELGVPLKSVLLSAHLAVLRLLTGAREPVTGMVMNGRLEGPDGDRMLGLFLNSVPLRPRSAALRWRELVEQAFAAERDGFAHRRYPLSEIRRALDGRAPFEVVFTLVHFHVYQRLAGAARIEVLGGDLWEATELPLMTTFILDPLSGRLTLQLEHDAAVLEPAQAQALPSYYRSAFEALTQQPEAPWESWQGLPEAARHQILHEWNDTGREPALDSLLTSAIARRATESPEAPAALWGDRRLTYAELEWRSDRLADELAAAGVGPEVLVGLFVERSFALLVGLLAIYKAGGAFLPLDPEHPAERLAWIQAAARPRVLLIDARLSERLPPHGGPVVACDCEGRPAGWRRGGQRRPAFPENLAYALYTSGSTGEPKGVLVTRGALAAYTREVAGALGLEAGDRFLQFAPMSFDVLLEEVFPVWLAGGAVALPERPGPLSLAELRRELEANAVTVAELPAAYWEEWVRELRSSAARVPPSLRQMILGCERAAAGAIADWRSLAGELPLLNIFGLTETTITSSLHRLDEAEPARYPIGRPLGGTRLLLLDSRMEPVLPGVAGELYIGGPLLGRGYLGRPDLTAERFLPDPHGESGARLYRTGDLATQHPDGTIELLGRLDDQVKVRGFRVELAEVEAALDRLPRVRQAVAALREDRAGHRALVAYVVPDGAEPLSVAALREQMQRELPAYMVPAVFMALPAIPLTGNGKIDRRALPAPSAVETEPASSSQPPRTPLEKRLSAIWSEVLGVEGVGADSGFFELGGHSLSATRLAARMRHLLGVDVPLSAVFEEPTLADLAARIEKILPALPAIQKEDDRA